MLNGFLVSLSGRLPDQCRNEHVFRSLPTARRTFAFQQADYLHME